MLDADITDSVIGEGCVIKASFSELSYFSVVHHYEHDTNLHISWKRYLKEQD
jgi:hypothetical protein